jgi:hypothetical protein
VAYHSGYLNYYKCVRCGECWRDEWDCMCDDRCPVCNLEMTPYESDDLINRTTYDHGIEGSPCAPWGSDSPFQPLTSS